ncbi:endonuclease V [Roseateles oligotrophus]|uniref:Endonuclease V n=1 Tax=Roseateles oligotrophus TaxID=1769250 RepID=A0ABT2YJZ2_9BURK|nr:endonuclease V [Roseateles oligotrophus]MCV2370386.1 endonuclease V [Roseateles oligotrophus]
MKLAIDVHFDSSTAMAAAVAFDDWDAAEPTRTFTSRIQHVEKAERGALDLRELPCILQLLREHRLEPELIIINGPVHLDAQETPGLGRHLYHALGGSCAIIGVSKTAPAGTPEQFEVHREEETRPLIVTCVDIDLGAAKARLRAMHGRKRVPTLLKLVTRLAKNSAQEL